MSRIALIDYKAGNLTSVKKALAHLGADVWCPTEAVEIEQAEGVIVPGVGHFEATSNLDEPWRIALLEHLEHGGALLGICLGLQWFYEGSEEAPHLRGLGLFAGSCLRLGNSGADLAANGVRLKVPHVGWNSLELTRQSALLAGVTGVPHAYFTHSYAPPVTADTVATTTHGEPFASVAERGRVFGVQFHPEKSSDVGLRMLRNFLDLL